MFLKTNTAAAPPARGRAVLALSGVASMLGVIADLTVRQPLRTERQFRRLQAKLRHLTRASSVELRNDVFCYGEAHFWGKQAFVDLDPGIARIVDGYIAEAKAV